MKIIKNCLKRRKDVLTVLLISFSSIISFAKKEYHPFLKEGKIWNYNVNQYYGTQYQTTIGNSRYFLKGDTVIGDLSCMKLWHERDGVISYHCALHESDRRVFAIMPGTIKSRLLFDFGLNQIEVSNWGCLDEAIRKRQAMPLESLIYRTGEGVCMLNRKETHEIQGRAETVLFLMPDYQPTQDVLIEFLWIEGVGSSLGLWPGYYSPEMHSVAEEFVNCIEDNILICTRQDFINLTPKWWSISNASTDTDLHSALYLSIDGKFMKHPMKGVNIVKTKNGKIKKILVR